MRIAKIAVFASLVSLLIAALAYWFYGHMETVKHWQYVPPAFSTTQDPFLGAQLLLEGTGRKVVRVRTAPQLASVPATGVILLLGTYQGLSKHWQARLLDWAHAGGHLVIAAQNINMGEKDSLLDRLRVPKLSAPGAKVLEDKSSENEDADAPNPAKKVAPERCETTPLQLSTASWLPGTTRSFRMDWFKSTLRAARYDALGVHIWDQAYGKGNITVLPSASPFQLYAGPAKYAVLLADLDHAQFLATVTALHLPHSTIWLVNNIGDFELWPALIQNAPCFLIGVALCLLLWLWSVLVRFGPLRDPKEDSRAALALHWLAAGRWLWHHQHKQDLLAPMRARTQRVLERKHPHLNPSERPDYVAQLGLLNPFSPAQINRALFDEPKNKKALIEAVQTLQQLCAHL